MNSLAEIFKLPNKNSDKQKSRQKNIFQPKPNLMFVGQIHGQKMAVPENVKQLINKYGAWYEGNGDDRIAGIKYEGSWDDKLAKDVRGYPKEFLFVIFTNTAVNEQKEILKGVGNIFDRILKTQNQFGYFKKRKFNAETLISFLKQMGEDYLSKSQMQATKANVDKFITDGEKQMWESGDTPAKQMADEANQYRDKWLLKQPEGVYFVGSDHLKTLRSLSQSKSGEAK